MGHHSSGGVTGNVGRSRVAAHRAKHARLDVSISPSMLKTVSELASENGAQRADVVRMLLRYALTNRDWKAQGLLWGLCDL